METHKCKFGRDVAKLSVGRDNQGLTVFDSEHETDAISAYFQTVIHATPTARMASSPVLAAPSWPAPG
jgi:hypothetical protein